MKIMIKSYLMVLLLFTIQSITIAGEVVSWKLKTGGILYSTPLVVNDTVFIGSEDSIFYAIDFNNGSEIWRYKAGNKILSSAAYSNIWIKHGRYGKVESYYFRRKCNQSL
jgi:outer membrane protein assembly factor BamB